MNNRNHTLLYRTNIEQNTPKSENLGDGELAINVNKNSPMLLFKNNNNEIEKIGAMSSITGNSENYTMTQKSITDSLNECTKILYFDEYKNIEHISPQTNLDIIAICYDLNTNTFVFKSTDGEYYSNTSEEQMSKYVDIHTFKPYINKLYVLSNVNQIYIYNNNVLQSTTLFIEQSKQDKLLSGKNICKINGKSLLESEDGTWNIQIDGSGSTQVKIIDNLSSESTDAALSARQGRVLNEQKVNKSDQIGKRYIAKDGSWGGEIFNDYINNTANGINSHAEGTKTKAYGNNSHAEGDNTLATGLSSHAEGGGANAVLVEASGDYSHAEGMSTKAYGKNSHAEGNSCQAVGDDSHCEGEGSLAGAWYNTSTQSVEFRHPGDLTNYSILGKITHAEGMNTLAIGQGAHTEGWYTQALGNFSHAEGAFTIANGQQSHTEGLKTITMSDFEHAEGTYNVSNQNILNGLSTRHSIGIGYQETQESPIFKINAFEVLDNGFVYIKDVGDYDGTNPSTTNNIQSVLNNKQNKLISKSLDNTNNLCTINGKSLLESEDGTWNIQIEGGSGTGSSVTVIDNLESESATFALSANQGRLLNINKLESSIYEEDKSTFALKSDLINFPIVNESNKVISILPNHYYLWGEVDTLTITLEPPTNPNIKNEYIIQFNSGTNPTSLLLPDTIKWVNNKFMKINSNKTYVITIVNNLAVGGEF